MPAPIVENAVFLPLDGFSSLVEDQVTIGVWVHLELHHSFSEVAKDMLPVSLYTFLHFKK